MNYVPFVVSLFIIEVILIVIIVHIIGRLIQKVSLTPEYKMSKQSQKLNILKRVLVEIVKPNELSHKFPNDYKKINIFTFPLVVLFFTMLFSGIFGDLLFFYEPSTNFIITGLKWLFKYVFRIIVIFVTVAVIINTMYRYYQFRKSV